jgi:hypothetical protein
MSKELRTFERKDVFLTLNYPSDDLPNGFETAPSDLHLRGGGLSGNPRTTAYAICALQIGQAQWPITEKQHQVRVYCSCFLLWSWLTTLFLAQAFEEEYPDDYPGEYLAENAGWLRIVKATALPDAPSSAANITLGRDVMIKKDGKAVIGAFDPSSDNEGERVKLTRGVASVSSLLKMNFKTNVVLVWYEHLRLASDDSFFSAIKKKSKRGASESSSSSGDKSKKSKKPKKKWSIRYYFCR